MVEPAEWNKMAEGGEPRERGGLLSHDHLTRLALIELITKPGFQDRKSVV